jgi:NADH-quinone oxidoreductase subunit N
MAQTWNVLINAVTFLPEILFSFFIVISLLFNVETRTNYFHKNSKQFFSHYFFLQIFLILTFLTIFYFYLASISSEAGFSSRDVLLNTKSTFYFKFITVLISIFALAPIIKAVELEKNGSPEFYALFLLSILATLLLFSANDFLMVYLLIEMQSLSFYVMTNLSRLKIHFVEAGTKYFLLGSIASCLQIFGLSLLYGCLGTLNFHDISIICSSRDFLAIEYIFSPDFFFSDCLASFALLIILISLFFKLGVFPFTFLAPGVYTNVPLSSTIIFSYLPKIAFIHLLAKIVFVFGGLIEPLCFLFFFLGFLSVILGSYLALNTYDFKDFINCSSASQIGFSFCLLGSGLNFDPATLYFFIVLYTINTVGLWLLYVIIYQSKMACDINSPLVPDCSIVWLSDVYSFCKQNKVMALTSIAFFFSNAGIPPFMGFVIKSTVLFDLVLKTNLISCAFLIVASVLSSYYYVKIISNSFFDKTEKTVFFLIPNSYLTFYMYISFNLIVFLSVSGIFSLDFFYSFFSYISLYEPY